MQRIGTRVSLFARWSTRCTRVPGAGRAASTGPLQGLMQDNPLLVSDLLDYAVRVHGDREIVSRTVEDPSAVHRCVASCSCPCCGSSA